MEINTLMVGDYIYKPNPTDNTKMVIGQVEPEDFYYGRIVYFEPIPLTKEILEKNDFIYTEREESVATEEYHIWRLEGTRFFLDDNSWWIEKKDDTLQVKFGIAKINYVHQLQHLFRLCNINKEIQL